ncbi:hypothetical protein Ancab_013293 [Ancistrocladus abbreviatus]
MVLNLVEEKMASEGFLTDEQREMLKIAACSSDNLSSSPKNLLLPRSRSLSSSPKSSFLFEHHAKASGCVKPGAAGGVP